MSLTLAQLRQLQADALIKEENARGLDPSKVDQNGQLNWAYRIIAAKCCLVADVALNLTAGVNTYNLRDDTTPIVGRKIIRPLVVYINQYPLRDASYRDFGMWNYEELMRRFPSWKTAGTLAPPTAAVFMNYNTLLLFPTPDAATAGQTHSVYGIYLPNDLALDSDVPDLPEEIHEAIAWLAAQFAITPTLTEAQGWQRMQQFQTYWTQIIQQVAEQNARTMQAWSTTQNWHDNDFILS